MRMPAIRVFLGTALVLVVAASTACKSKSSASEGPPKGPVQERRGLPPALRLTCPTLDSVLVPASRSRRGHRVTLKWKASLHTDPKQPDAVGYCIYRGPQPNVPPTELVNHLPFPETQCVDDSVQNGKQYYYVVRAISAQGMMSEISEPPAPAKIPTTPPSSFRTGTSIPLCRESPGIKNP